MNCRARLGLSLALLLGGALAPRAALAGDPFLRRTPTVAAVEKVGPAVVNITTEQAPRQRPSSGNPFFDRFFQDLFEPTTWSPAPTRSA
jgi:serine protease Do